MFRAKRQYFKLPRSRLGFREETQSYAKRNRSQIFFLTYFVYRIRGQNLLKPRPDWSPLGVTKSLSHAQIAQFVTKQGAATVQCCRAKTSLGGRERRHFARDGA